MHPRVLARKDQRAITSRIAQVDHPGRVVSQEGPGVRSRPLRSTVPLRRGRLPGEDQAPDAQTDQVPAGSCWSARRAVDRAPAVHSRSTMATCRVGRFARGPVRTKRSSISWASRTALTARRRRSTAAACGESGSGVPVGCQTEGTVSDPSAGEGAFHGGLPGALAHGGPIHPASADPQHAPRASERQCKTAGSTQARCQRARRPQRQTGSPVEGVQMLPRSGRCCLAPEARAR